MKFFFAFALIVAALACANADCNSDGNGQPDCVGARAGQKYRNFWDPTHYWSCASDGAEADNVECPIATGFLDSVGECVSWDQWVWTPPCPDTDSETS
ncbi:uncharacterized protein LOC119685266 [Teleopsis dalmanni]|uniref:uncharacterized protein LOC119685266 n=1 Tax=Teleopsis dalmanni TaxID=139649 RepID=UPI0018CE4085|nr:uncharacterized protein LOC119685266 [Teleopsis dalmanni]